MSAAPLEDIRARIEGRVEEIKATIQEKREQLGLGNLPSLGQNISRPRILSKIRQGGLLKQGIPGRGTGLLIGTARTGMERGAGKRLTDVERAARHKRIFGTKKFNPGVVDTPPSRASPSGVSVEREKSGVPYKPQSLSVEM